MDQEANLKKLTYTPPSRRSALWPYGYGKGPIGATYFCYAPRLIRASERKGGGKEDAGKNEATEEAIAAAAEREYWNHWNF